MPMRGRKAWLFVVLLLQAPLLSAQPPDLTEIERLLEAERPEEALERLQPLLAARPDEAEALLLSSTAHLMVGELERGRDELERALGLDPALRQGWLNKAALAVADGDLAAALSAFGKARQLDPAAADTYLNVGAVLLLSGDLAAAAQSFSDYLQRSGGSAEAYYLVATNYASAGAADIALDHLEEAVRRDERQRLKARADVNFGALADNRRFQTLLATDAYVPPPNAHTAVRRFPAPYRAGEGKLLRAVLDALQFARVTVDPRVEVTADWALVWADARIKVTNGPDGQGEVQLSAPLEAFTATEWLERSEELLRQIQIRLAR